MRISPPHVHLITCVYFNIELYMRTVYVNMTVFVKQYV